MDWGRFVQQMASMARGLLAQESVAATLERITASATELVEGCDPAGILVLHDSTVETLARTHQLVIDSDQPQQHLGEGPCFDAAMRKRAATCGPLALGPRTSQLS